MSEINYNALTSPTVIETLFRWKTYFENNEIHNKLADVAQTVAVDSEKCRDTYKAGNMASFLSRRIDRLLESSPQYEDIEWLALSLKKGLVSTDDEVKNEARRLISAIQSS